MITAFWKFLETDAGRKVVDPALLPRLTHPGAPRVDSLSALIRVARERWPDHFAGGYRDDAPGDPLGRGAMKAIWAAYLSWAETAPEQSSGPKAPGPKAVAR